MSFIIIVETDEKILASILSSLGGENVVVQPATIAPAKDVLDQVASLVEGQAEPPLLLVGADVRLPGARVTDAFDLVRLGMLDARLRDKIGFAVYSGLSRQTIERTSGVRFSPELNVSFVRLPFSPADIAVLANKCQHTGREEAGQDFAARRFNLATALTRLSSAKHDSRNAFVAFLSVLNLPSTGADTQALDRLITIVRRDEGKKETWVQWLETELTLFQDDMRRMGFDPDREFPNALSLLNASREVLHDYLVLFHLGQAEQTISHEDKEGIRRDATKARDALLAIGRAFDDIKEQLGRKYT